MKPRITRIYYFSGLIVIGLISMAYALFPYWAQMWLERNLPQDWTLQVFSIERPSFEQLNIHRITVSDTQGHRLTVQGLRLAWRVFDRQLESITIDKIDGQWSFDLLMKKLGFEATNKTKEPQPTQVNKTLRLPAITLRELAINVGFDEGSSILLKGQLALHPSNTSGDLQLTTSWNDRLHLQLEHKHKQVEVKLQVGALSLTEWAAYWISHVLPAIPELNGQWPKLTGQISGMVKARLRLSEDPIEGGYLVVERVPESVWLMALDSTLKLQALSLHRRQWRLVEFNSDIDSHFEQGQWQAQIDHLASELELYHPFDWLSKSTLSVQSDDLLLSADQDGFQVSGSLQADQQSIRFTSRWPWDLRQTSQHQIALDMKQLDQQWSPLLESWVIANLSTELSFELKQVNHHWEVLNAKSGLWQLKDVTLKQAMSGRIDSAQLELTLAPHFRLEQPQWRSIGLTIDGLNIESKPWMSWTQVDLSAEATREPDKIRVVYQASPSSSELLSQKLLLNGTEVRPKVDGRLAIHLGTKDVDATVSAEVDVYSPKAMLGSLAPRQTKILHQLSISEPLRLNSQFKLRYHPESDILINGKAELAMPLLSLGGVSVSDASIQLLWPQWQDWYQVHLSSQFELDYLQKDHQRHTLDLDALLLPDFRFQHLAIRSQLLGGEAELVANDSYRHWSHSAGRLTMKDIQLKKISDLLDAEDLSFSGGLNGTLPFSIEQNQLHFKQGVLYSEKGQVNYIPGGVKKELTKESASDIASIALQNFHYHSLMARLNKGGPCGFDFDIRLEGHNPDLGDNAEQVFNIKYQPASNVNLYYLLTLGEDFIRQLEQEQLHSACVH